MFSSFSLSFLSFLKSLGGFFYSSFSKNVVFKGLSCLLFSRFCDVASLLAVCEWLWRFGFLVSRSAAFSFSVAVCGEREYYNEKERIL
jgi:hypothetical protein